ncbi:MAG: hypothetical protein IJR17_06485 [Clostridia bacterium]|nr:hypothetical protein [Clostridia bacterium]
MTRQDVDYILSLLSVQDYKHVINSLRAEPSFSIDGFSKSPNKAPRTKVADAIMKKDNLQIVFRDSVIALSKPELFQDGQLITDRERLLRTLNERNAASIVAALSINDTITDELKSIVSKHIHKQEDESSDSQVKNCDPAQCVFLNEEKSSKEKGIIELQGKIDKLKNELQKSKTDNKSLLALNKKLSQKADEKERACEETKQKSQEELDKAYAQVAFYESSLESKNNECTQLKQAISYLEREKDLLVEKLRSLQSKCKNQYLVFANEDILFPQRILATAMIHCISYSLANDAINYAEYKKIIAIRSLLSFGDQETIRTKFRGKVLLLSNPGELLTYLYNEEDKNGNV